MDRQPGRARGYAHPVLRLFLVGRLAATSDDEPLIIPTGERVQALIGWLGLNPGPHPRSVVAAALWPEADVELVRARLRTAVWTLRQAWGPAGSVLITARDVLGFAGDLIVDALTVPAPGAPLPDGELLPDVADAWAEDARVAYRERQLARFRALSREAERDGSVAAAARWAARRCALSPWDEAAHRDLINLLLASGDHAGAVDAARQFTARLRDELGIEPSAVTRAAHAAVTRGSLGARRAPLYGRSADLRMLAATWKATAAGRGRVILISGEAGIGKTTLLNEFSRRVTEAGARVGSGSGLDVGGSTPFAAWLDIARTLVATLPPVPAAHRWPGELNRLAPDLGSALGRAAVPAAVATPELERLRVFEAVLRLVEWAAGDRPLLIILDDCHHADRSSLQLMAHLSRQLAGLPVLIVLAGRDHPRRVEIDELLAAAVRAGLPVDHLELRPIDDSAIAAIAASFGVGDTGRVVHVAEGNPLLATESARAIATGSAAPPPNLRTAVRVLIGRLPPTSQRLTELLAVAGRPLTRTELDRLPDVAGTAVAAEALATGLLVRHEGRLGFRHALLREAAYADLTDPAALHEEVAEAVDPALGAEAARHWELAGRTERAAACWAGAARYARTVGGLVEAAEALDRATDCSPDDPDLWLELQEVWAWLGNREQEDHAWRRALSLLPPQRLAATWTRRGKQLRYVICDPARSWSAYREAMRHLDPADEQLHILIDVGLAWNEAVAGDPAIAAQLCSRVEAQLANQDQIDVRLDLIEIGLLSLMRQGRFREAGDLAGSAFSLLDAAAGPGQSYAIWANAAAAYVSAGDDEAALACIEWAIEGTRDLPVLFTECLGSRAHLQARLGLWESAHATLAEQATVAQRLDAAQVRASATSDAGLVALAEGDYPLAAERLRIALADLHSRRPALALARAEALARNSQPDEAAQQLRAALQEPTGPADQPWSLVPRVSGVQALIALAQGRVEQARHYLDESAAAWTKLLPRRDTYASEGYLAGLLDLGKPPVVGLVEPAKELAKITAELERLNTNSTRRG